MAGREGGVSTEYSGTTSVSPMILSVMYVRSKSNSSFTKRSLPLQQVGGERGSKPHSLMAAAQNSLGNLSPNERQYSLGSPLGHRCPLALVISTAVSLGGGQWMVRGSLTYPLWLPRLAHYRALPTAPHTCPCGSSLHTLQSRGTAILISYPQQVRSAYLDR